MTKSILSLLGSALFFMVFLTACGGDTAAANGESAGTDAMAGHADDPDFAGAHDSPEDMEFTPRGSMIELPAAGGRAANAYFLPAADASSKKYLFVIQEYWGLNEYVKRESDRLHNDLENVNVIALDMYDGKVAADPETAKEYMQSADETRLKAIIEAGLARAGADAQVATIGWCFGGGWSLRTALAAGKRAESCVMFYGMPVTDAAALAPLQAPVLAIFADKDKWINEEVKDNFIKLAKATGKKLTTETYDADHAFANPSNPNYNAEAREDANKKALAFIQSKW